MTSTLKANPVAGDDLSGVNFLVVVVVLNGRTLNDDRSAGLSR